MMLFISKFVVSIVISIDVGISNVSLSMFKLSCIPGNVSPTTIVLLPSSIAFPFVTSMFLLLSLFMYVPVATTNGVYIFSVFPFIWTSCSSLFSNDIVILTFPDFPAISSELISFPSSSYLMFSLTGNSWFVSPL